MAMHDYAQNMIYESIIWYNDLFKPLQNVNLKFKTWEFQKESSKFHIKTKNFLKEAKIKLKQMNNLR